MGVKLSLSEQVKPNDGNFITTDLHSLAHTPFASVQSSKMTSPLFCSSKEGIYLKAFDQILVSILLISTNLPKTVVGLLPFKAFQVPFLVALPVIVPSVESMISVLLTQLLTVSFTNATLFLIKLVSVIFATPAPQGLPTSVTVHAKTTGLSRATFVTVMIGLLTSEMVAEPDFMLQIPFPTEGVFATTLKVLFSQLLLIGLMVATTG